MVIKMTNERYWLLQNNTEAKLTEDEIKEGWHFCCEWDYMLIHKSWPEAESCLRNEDK